MVASLLKNVLKSKGVHNVGPQLTLPPSPQLDSTRPRPSCAHMSECGCNFLSHTPPQFFFPKKLGFFLLEKLVPIINTSGWVFPPTIAELKPCTVPNSICMVQAFIIITHPTNIDDRSYTQCPKNNNSHNHQPNKQATCHFNLI